MHKPLTIPGAALALLCAAVVSAFASGEWEELRGCRLIEHEANDGDSFHVDVDGEERIFRLYFADTPEAESGGYVTERVTEQAKQPIGVMPDITDLRPSAVDIIGSDGAAEP
jgi:hypothetical protein